MSDYCCGYDPIELERAEILMGVDGSGIHIEPRAGFRFTCDVQDIPIELFECVDLEGSKRDRYRWEGFAALDYSYDDPPFVAGYDCIGGYKCGEHECPHMHTDAYYAGEPPWNRTSKNCLLCEEPWTKPGYIYDGEEARVLIYVKRMIQIGWAHIGCLYDGTIVAPDRDSALGELEEFLEHDGLNRRRISKIMQALRSRGIYYFSRFERFLLCMGDLIELGEVSALEALCD